MLARLASAGARSPRRVLALAAIALLAFAVLGGPTPGLLKARNDFEDPASQSARGRTLLEHASGQTPFPEVLALVQGTPSSAAVAHATSVLRADPEVGHVAPAGVSREGNQSVLAATLRASDERNDAVKRLQRAFAGDPDVRLGGSAVAFYEIGKQTSKDLGFAEALAFPLLAILALLIFRGVAALLPLAVGGTSVLGAFAALRAVNVALPLSVFALNVVIGLGLGLAIDYSLFLVSRFREELGAGRDVSDAIRTTMETAGRTVLFSSLTVAVALASLTVFPLRFLQSMGIGGAVVALAAAAVSLTLLPALFALLGARIGKHVPGPVQEGRWYRFAHAVLRRPGLVAAATALALLAIASPTLGVRWTGVDVTVLPAGHTARSVNDTIARDFPQVSRSPAVVAVRASAAQAPAVAAYAVRLRSLSGVASVAPPRRLAGEVWSVAATLSGDAVGASAQRAVAAIRALDAPFTANVTGEAATFADQRHAIAANLPLALAILALGTLLILWAMTGSVILPFKSLVMNALSVAAATGLLVLVFQDGRLQGPLGYTSQGGLEQSDFLVLAAIAFALSTDYGVFLLTRIKEARDRGASDDEAVAVGLQHTGRIVTAAAVLLAVAIGAFATSQIVFLKEIGLGAVAAVLLDAFVVRALLVPSLMGLLGRWNWWSPSPLRRAHARLRLAESAPAPAS